MGKGSVLKARALPGRGRPWNMQREDWAGPQCTVASWERAGWTGSHPRQGEEWLPGLRGAMRSDHCGAVNSASGVSGETLWN